jgi:hypothetical protein
MQIINKSLQSNFIFYIYINSYILQGYKSTLNNNKTIKYKKIENKNYYNNSKFDLVEGKISKNNKKIKYKIK